MYKQIKWLFVLIQVTQIAAQLTDKQKCKITDSACIKKTAKELIPYFVAGIPELGVNSLDVMNVNEVKIDLSGLKIKITEIQCKGLKKAVIENIKFDMDKRILELVYHTDISGKGKYIASGRLLILPVTGDGEATMKLKSLHIEAKMPFDIKKNKEGKDVIELKGISFNYDIKDNAHFEFTNLYNGNKVASDIFHQFMNSNWRDVTKEFGRPTLQEPMTKVYEAIKTYLLSQPLENFILSN